MSSMFEIWRRGGLLAVGSTERNFIVIYVRQCIQEWTK